MKYKCARCGRKKLSREFRKCARTKNGLQSYCSRCNTISVRIWARANREKIQAKQKRSYCKAKDAVFNHYGKSCSCCGETEYLFLTVDHVKNNGGGRDRKLRGFQMYKFIIAQGFPEDFQVLCWNCNSGRARNGGICPHLAMKY